MMTEEMFEKCLNETHIEFGFLSPDVQRALRDHSNYVQVFVGKIWLNCRNAAFFSIVEYRIDPDVKSFVVIEDKKSLKLKVLEKCKNKELQIFAHMDKEVQEMINECEKKYGSKSLEVIGQCDGKWCNVSSLLLIDDMVGKFSGRIFRISEEYIEKIKKDIETKKIYSRYYYHECL